MFQRILIPLDGSPRAERIAPLGARLARHTGGEVILLQITSDGSAMPTQESVPWAPRHAEAAAYLDQISRREEFADLRTRPIIREGDIVDGILVVAAASAVDLIIMNHQPHSDESGRASESVAERIAREAPTSVLLVREQQSPLACIQAAQPCALRLLIPLDGSALAETAIAPAAELLEALGAPERSSLHLAQIIPNLSGWRHAARYLAHIAERIRSGALTNRPLNVTWSVIPHVDAAEALVQVATEGEDPDSLTTWSVARDLGLRPADSDEHAAGFQRCDAIVMTTHGHGGLRHVLIGSVAKRVLRVTDTPLLLVRRTTGAAPPHPLVPELDVEQWRT